MKIKAAAADLQMERFVVTDLELTWIPADGEDEEEIDFQNHSIEIDMDLRSSTQHLDEFYYVMEIFINNGKNAIPGYKIWVRANSLFTIRDFESKDEATLSNFKFISPVSLMINTLRSVISDMSSFSVYGRYNLPAIDIVALINSKSRQLKKKKAKIKK